MKISLNWVKEFIPVKIPIEELVKKIGTQLGAVESVIDYGVRYGGAIIVKVVSCQDHPNADRLHICLIDDGGVTKGVDREDNGLVQVVCGAPNIAEGMNVVWLPPGVTVPETYGHPVPMVLESRLVRAVISNGMIASAKELALGDDDTGILEIKKDVNPGTTLVEHYGLNDYIIDIENKMFTHRPDCFGILGIAREIAGIQQQAFKSPDWYLKSYLQAATDTAQLPLLVRNEIPDLVPRFMAVAMNNINVKPSPVKLQSYLNRMGVRPINNVVDVTNFLMLLTGQPMHAYDYDKVKAFDQHATATLVARYPKKDEQITLLNGKTITPHEKTIMIATDSTAIGLGGVMGGQDTEVDNQTKNIILEAATFDMYSVRRTSMALGLFTDAVTRFSKGQSPLQNDSILAQAMHLIEELADGVLASPIIDDHHLLPNMPVTTTAEFINQRLGLNLDSGQITTLLQNVEFVVVTEGENIIVKPPFWRTDINIAEDIVEEVGRLYGYDKLPLMLPARGLVPARKNSILELKRQIRCVLSASGANEVLTYSFVHGNLIDKVGQDRAKAYQLANALSPDLQYYRLSLLPSLLEKVHSNIKAGFDQFAIYELGKAHILDWLDDERLPKEEQRVAFIFAANQKAAVSYKGAAYFEALGFLGNLLQSLGLNLALDPMPEQWQQVVNAQLSAPFATNRSATVVNKTSGDVVGVIGEFKPEVGMGLKLPDYCAGFELDLTKLLKLKSSAGKYVPLSRYPKVEQDISLKVDADLTYSQLFNSLYEELDTLKPEESIFVIEPLDIFMKHGEKDKKNVSFRITVTSYQKTLKADEVNSLLDAVATSLKHRFSIERI